MIKSCKECMNEAPYKWCCAKECGEHEFCRNCEYIPQHECLSTLNKDTNNNKEVNK